MKKNYAAAALITAIITALSLTAGAEEIKVVPVGKAVGIQIYTDGLLVVGTNEVGGRNAAKESGIETGDRIIAVNGISELSTEKFSEEINENPGGVNLDIARDNQNLTIYAVPAKCEDNVYRLGLWIRDSCAGIGTLTYYDPSANTFAALGHAINDIDTGNILPAKAGNILDCSIVSVTKSKRGLPGEINAVFGDTLLGKIDANSPLGIFGETTGGFPVMENEAIAVASRSQVYEGDAYILSDIIGGKTEKYNVKIDKITNDADKSIVLEITDERLKEAAGGIVQGMSGSPIIQDGRFAGAVTHVFVNSPLKGYGTLAENMIDMQKRSPRASD